MLTIAPGHGGKRNITHFGGTKRTSHNIKHISVILLRKRCCVFLALLQGFKHANCRTMHVAGQERDANSSAFSEALKLYNELIAFLLWRSHESRIVVERKTRTL